MFDEPASSVPSELQDVPARAKRTEHAAAPKSYIRSGRVQALARRTQAPQDGSLTRENPDRSRGEGD